MTIQAIETTYKGYRFRSRLEARWAVFFDALDLKWEYEPQGYVLEDKAPYLPDFLVDPGSPSEFWFEVKGQFPTGTEIKKAALLARGTRKLTYLYFGPIEIPGPGLSTSITTWDGFMEPAGQAIQWHNEIGWIYNGSDALKWQCGLQPTAFRFDARTADRHASARSGLWWWMDCPHCGRVVPKLDGQVGWCPTIPDDRFDLVAYPRFSHETPRLCAAYRAARSARFEHGESGSPPFAVSTPESR